MTYGENPIRPTVEEIESMNFFGDWSNRLQFILCGFNEFYPDVKTLLIVVEI